MRVTNGATGDGYYMRPVTKLAPKIVKVAEPPKYHPVFQPNVSYWELLRRNQNKAKALADDMEQTMPNAATKASDEVPLMQIQKIQPIFGNQDIYADQLLFQAKPTFTPDGPLADPQQQQQQQFTKLMTDMSGATGDRLLSNQL